MQTLGSWLLPLSLTTVLLADQVLKSRMLADFRTPPAIRIGPGVRIQPVRTHRMTAGRLGAHPVLMSFAWMICLLALLVAPHAGRFGAPISQAALGAALGGAAGNLFDVLVRKGVVDYVVLGAWPAFNLADVAIVVGVVVGLVVR